MLQFQVKEYLENDAGSMKKALTNSERCWTQQIQNIVRGLRPSGPSKRRLQLQLVLREVLLDAARAQQGAAVSAEDGANRATASCASDCPPRDHQSQARSQDDELFSGMYQ